MVDGNRSTRHSNTLECRYAVLTAVMNDHKCKNPRPRSGMDYIRGVLRGSHLLAHTWANRPTLRGRFPVCSFSGINAPPSMVIFFMIPQEGGSVDRAGGVFSEKGAAFFRFPFRRIMDGFPGEAPGKAGSTVCAPDWKGRLPEAAGCCPAA